MSTQRAAGLPKPEGPESRMGAFHPPRSNPGTLAYPHVSASSAFLSQRHYAEATKPPPGVAPLACEPLSLPTHCLLPLALSQAPAPASVRT